MRSEIFEKYRKLALETEKQLCRNKLKKNSSANAGSVVCNTTAKHVDENSTKTIILISLTEYVRR